MQPVQFGDHSVDLGRVREPVIRSPTIPLLLYALRPTQHLKTPRRRRGFQIYMKFPSYTATFSRFSISKTLPV